MTTNLLDRRPAPLSWQPRANGNIYCAPACGRGCTKAEFDHANKVAQRTLRTMKTKGWVIRVW